MRNRFDKTKQMDFVTWSDRLERLLVRWIIILAVLLTVSQGLLQFPSVRERVTTTDASEGVPYHPRPAK
ncbi:hypothetical protein SD71_17810 [Cohnella kolymensis]|uniref:Polysaccharide deacetylase n=1 Tax=Cohnella kolymensis TaxID=1590652 RepID=A0ABR5A375_9BACL|nr:hypothetical protein [Cohnella kolymensis]KIL34857.1 hypothetical protein SD71_17810 [Cohnella kolymensis]